MTDTPVPATARPRNTSARVARLLGARPDGPQGGADEGLGQGMELALTLAVFLGLGWLLDSWIGIFPVLTIALVVFAAIGTGVKMWIGYDARMRRLEAERLAARTQHQSGTQHQSPEPGKNAGA